MASMRRSKTKHGKYASPGHPDLPSPGQCWNGQPKSEAKELRRFAKAFLKLVKKRHL